MQMSAFKSHLPLPDLTSPFWLLPLLMGAWGVVEGGYSSSILQSPHVGGDAVKYCRVF